VYKNKYKLDIWNRDQHEANWVCKCNWGDNLQR